MSATLNIVVGGYIAGYPLGGMTWHHLNYLLGLRELGHEVSYLEDGAHHPPFDPSTGDSGVPDYGVAYLRRTFQEYGLDIPFHYRYGTYSAGLSIDEIDEALRRADLLICVSGVTPISWRPLPRRSLVIDTDPVFTQLAMRQNAALREYYRSFSACATFGRFIGTPACPLPAHGIDWITTNQPVSLRHWPVAQAPEAWSAELSTPVGLPGVGCFTTIGKWEQAGERHVEFAGRRLLSSKAVEWEKVIELPRRTGWRMELAMQGMPPGVRQRYEAEGWIVGDAERASVSCPAFQRYIRSSAGEFTVVKQIYNAVRSGWFSDRSACFLATGRPVVTQASGFERWLPTGEGLFSFETIDEAAAALEEIRRDPAHHARAARKIAERFFDSTTVLRDLLDRVV